MADTAGQTGREGLVGEVTSQVGDAASSAQEKAVELKEQGRGALGTKLDESTTQIGGQARSMAHALRRSGEQLRSDGQDGQAAGLAENVADRIERLGDYLEHTSGDQLLNDVEDFARRRPWLVAGIGIAVGLAASRFLKASSERRYGESSWQRRPYGDGSYQGSTYGSVGDPADEPLSRESYATSG